jgi:type IV pilus assembly protein PilY1
VLFGTGKYLEPTVDNTQDGQVTQTFYGVWDDGESNYTTITRSVMQKQEILGEGAGSDGNVYRVTTDNDVVWIDAQKNIQKRGWYLDLLDTENNNTKNFGERQVSDSLIRNGRVIFTTLIPSADPCSFGGEGWLMELNAVTGGRTAFTVFDATGDGLFGQADYIDYDGASGAAVAAAPSGRKSTVGIVPTPAILSREGGGMEYKYQPGAKSGVIEVVKENPGPGDFGRNSWIQLFK